MAGIIIVGAGQAAVQAAASLRQEGCKDEITIFGDEPWLPYQRPLLSKQYLLGTETEEQIYQRAEKFYEDQRVALRLGERIESIDVAAKTVTSAKGEVIPYKELLLATGSRPRILKIQGSELSGIHYLRTLGDVNAIKNEMAPGKRLVIIGGGYIGLEVASVAVTLGLDVTVLEMEERILKRVTTAEMSEFYHQLHAGRGVKILLRTAVSGFEGDGHITHVLCG
ncbi:MAG: FAD-dependent oxidoreductase, partial [Pseudomonadales bacterium]|nr:FAD-dependent oxidoreductase [Pseudomonadales bacterium]